MDKITKQDILKLSKPQKHFVVSIYMPTDKTVGANIRPSKVHFKNLLNQARHQLLELGVGKSTIDKQLEAAEELVNDDVFWRNQSHGLAVFLSPKKARIYRLPISFVEMSAVSKRFHLKQLLQVLDSDHSFHILTLSPNSVRLFEADLSEAVPLPGDKLPGDITEALGTDDNERRVQHHVGGSALTTAGKSAIYHGHGASKDMQQIDLVRFIRHIAGKVANKLHRSDKPLVVAGVDEIVTIFRDNYPHDNLHEEHLYGNYDEVEAKQLHEQLLPLLQAAQRDKIEQNLRRYHDIANAQPEIAADVIDDIIYYAREGRVDTLLVNSQPICWGEMKDDVVDPHEHEQRAGLSDLSDIATALALNTGSNIGFFEPEENQEAKPAMAILRY